MKKNLTFLFLLILATGFANDSECECCCYIEEECCNWGLEIDAEFLWWQAYGDRLNYGVLAKGTSDQIPDVSFTTQASETWLEFNPKWKPGVRLRAAKDLCPDGVGIFGEWTWYETRNKERNCFVRPEGENVFFGFESDFLQSGGGKSTTQLQNIKINGDFNFLLNRIDLGFFKDFCFCNCYHLQPYAAFTYAHTKENMTIKSRFTSTISPFNDSFEKYKIKTTLDGFGTKLGFTSDWALFSCFYLSFQGSLTGLWGDFDEKRDDFYENFNPVGLGIQETEIEKLRLSNWQGRLFSQLQISLLYDTCFCDCYHFNARLGWEHQTLFNQTNWMETNSPIRGSRNLKNSANLYIQGLVAGIGLSF